MEERDVKKMFQTYGTPHRMFVQAMLTRGIISSSELSKLFELICKRCDIESPNNKKYQQDFYQTINNKLSEKANLKLIKVMDEAVRAKTSFLLLVNKTDRSKDDNKLTIKDQAIFQSHEMEYLKLIVDHIMKDPAHEVAATRALSISNWVSKNTKKIQTQEAEVILQKFKDHKWLTETKDSGAIILSTRFIYEMEPYLREVYPDDVGKCAKCGKVVIRGVNCPNEDCDCRYHMYCAVILKKTKDEDGKIITETIKEPCVKCKTLLPDRFETSSRLVMASSRKRRREESGSESE